MDTQRREQPMRNASLSQNRNVVIHPGNQHGGKTSTTETRLISETSIAIP